MKKLLIYVIVAFATFGLFVIGRKVINKIKIKIQQNKEEEPIGI